MASITELKDTDIKSRALLAGVNTGLAPEKYARSMQELKGLAEACDLEVVSMVVQNAAEITHRTYMGSGKVEELREEIRLMDADVVIFNEALSPLQVRNLEKELDTEVLDKTGIILQIFSQRARTREARLQVETARLKYLLPRLAGMHAELSRQGGGSGRLSNKGAGEQKLELDRRRIEHRISQMEKELKVVDKERETQRSRRLQSGIARVALVGYTNAGKSTLMNALLGYCDGEDADQKKVLEKDMLFATLDTSVRRIEAPGHLPFLLSDTVGFISDLPHSLVKAFRSTLEEVCQADLLLEIIDFSDPDCDSQIEVTARTLQEIGAGHIPLVYVYNKCDMALEDREEQEEEKIISMAGVLWGKGRQTAVRAAAPPLPLRRNMPAGIPFVQESTDPAAIYMAAKKGIGLEDLLTLIDHSLGRGHSEFSLLLPYAQTGLVQELRTRGMLKGDPSYEPEGISLTIRCSPDFAKRYAPYLQ